MAKSAYPDCAKPAAYYGLKDYWKLERPFRRGVFGVYREDRWHAHVVDHAGDRVTCMGAFVNSNDAAAAAEAHARRMGLGAAGRRPSPA